MRLTLEQQTVQRLKQRLGDLPTKEKTYLGETVALIERLRGLDDAVTRRDPYQRIKDIFLTSKDREYLLVFNSMLQRGLDLLNHNSVDDSGLEVLELTLAQITMPGRYVAACCFIDIAEMYESVPNNSEKGEVNKGLMGGLFVPLMQDHPVFNEISLQTLNLLCNEPDFSEYRRHITNFAGHHYLQLHDKK
jgi:hypothetical protein